VVKLALNDIYCKDTACACVHYIAARTYGETQKLLKEQYNIDLQIDYFMETYELEDALLSGKYDGVICKPWLALKLEKKSDIEYERIADILDPSNNQWLTGIVIVSTNSPARSLKDLAGKKIVIGDADSYEKHYATKRLFANAHVVFGKVLETASCIENIGKLMDGEVDAAVISDYSLVADCAVDFAKPADFRIIARTERIPLTSVLINDDKLTDDEQDRLQAALLAITKKGVPKSFLSRGFVKPAKWEPPELED
jgi:ABC-type phosphate/phosphonate transport system substrate-binding protein